MMTRIKVIGVLLVALTSFRWGYAQTKVEQNVRTARISRLELPEITSKDAIVKHFAYTLSYSEPYEQAKWVAYELTKEHTLKAFERANKFITDPLVKTGSATDTDYKGSGYDRGHLAPAGDMSWSAQAMRESFYYSNMSPQEPSFNRGIWKKLEELVRTWANENQTIYITTGPILKTGLAKIGINGVSVPKYYYKVILDYKEPSIKGIGFILPNSGTSMPLSSYAVSIDSVEKVTGINFFASLPDDEENVIESSISTELWSWKTSISTHKKTGTSLSVQCNGITKVGSRCRKRTLNTNGFCYLHQNQINDSSSSVSSKTIIVPESSQGSELVQCSGITKAGVRCKRMTRNASGRCYQH